MRFFSIDGDEEVGCGVRGQPLRACCVSVKHALRPALDVVFRANNATDKFTGDILRATFGQVKVGVRRSRKNGGLSTGKFIPT